MHEKSPYRNRDGRSFRQSGNLTFFEDTCFVATDYGVSVNAIPCFEVTIRVHNDLLHGDFGGLNQSGEFREIEAVNRETPRWDAELRKLYFRDQVVKRFKWPAMNQEVVLTVFQEEGWPERIDDPLAPVEDKDPKRRLADTIKCLNRKQSRHLIKFHGDGTGEGITWEKVCGS